MENEKCLSCQNVGKDLCRYLRENLNEKLELCETIFPLIELSDSKNATEILGHDDLLKNIYWLQSGYGRYFKYKNNDYGKKEQDTIAFFKPGKIIFAMDFFLNDKDIEGDLQFEAGSILIPFPMKYFNDFKLEGLEPIVLFNRIMAIENSENLKIMGMMKMKARQRYKEFVDYYGVEIGQFFAVKDIASYLGIAPTFLSRIRAA